MDLTESGFLPAFDMRMEKVLEVPVKTSVTKRAVLGCGLKIPESSIWLFELKGQLKVEYFDGSMMLVIGDNILH